jgi:hypothetical protein
MRVDPGTTLRDIDLIEALQRLMGVHRRQRIEGMLTHCPRLPEWHPQPIEDALVECPATWKADVG